MRLTTHDTHNLLAFSQRHNRVRLLSILARSLLSPLLAPLSGLGAARGDSPLSLSGWCSRSAGRGRGGSGPHAFPPASILFCGSYSVALTCCANGRASRLTKSDTRNVHCTRFDFGALAVGGIGCPGAKPAACTPTQSHSLRGDEPLVFWFAHAHACATQPRATPPATRPVRKHAGAVQPDLPLNCLPSSTFLSRSTRASTRAG